ncbi:MAG TPA: 3-deoxy-D-manno-octulosonic acid transferase [Candidatus Angelobacter sp.]|nr:3-deoxy-D-manno-octulosonic acid transferase [Candidatus Angelobacter sp.]
MYVLYSFLLACAAILSLPWWALQMLRLGKYRAGLGERLGFVSPRLKDAKPGCVWVHAVSVGEVLAVSRLVTELQSAYPGTQIFVSTTTATGQSLARERFGDGRCFFMPLDFGFSVRSYLNALQPRLLVLAETEFWPNLLHLARKRRTTVAIVNARISDRSFPRYRRFRWFFSRVLSQVDLFLAQTAVDAERLRAIGAAPERVRVSGNLKFDFRPGTTSKLAQDLRASLGKDALVIVCGSTAEGEEGPLLEAFKAILQKIPQAVMILAPRHPERFDKVAGLIASLDIPYQRRTTWTTGAPLRGAVLLLDSVGELASVYALADVAFVGGSLVPTGGHNILEPAQYGAAIVVGPHTFNFREIVKIFADGHALRVVALETLSRQLLDLLQHPEQRRRLGENGKRLFQQHSGATEKTVHALGPLLRGPAMEQR